MEPTALIDKVLPGPHSALGRSASALQSAVSKVTQANSVRPLVRALHGNEMVGHPMHPVVVALPVGAWSLVAWHDARGALTGDSRHDHVADAALRFGIAGAVAAVVTGLVQYPDAEGAAQRESLIHAVQNTVALGLYVASAAVRARGRRTLGRQLATGALGMVGVSGWLGGDIAFRHGVGVRSQALREPGRPASVTNTDPLDTSAGHHS